MTIKKALKFSGIFSILFLLTLNALAQVDVPRKTQAVTYPLDEEVMVRFRGTTRFPRMKGEAKIERTERNGTEISLSVSKMPRPFELGAGYATYVLWAISPNGQVDNLGEIKRRGFFEFDSNIKVTTRLQTFALIITAEPHFLVNQPSRAVMLENLSPYTRSGRTVPTTTTIQYFGNSSDYFNNPRTPEIADVDYRKIPIAVLQAQQAIALAKYAGAERDAKEEFDQAFSLYQNAENAWKAGRDDEYIDVAARKAVSAAVQAESVAHIRRDAREKRNDRLKQDAELRQAENKFVDAQNDISELKAGIARETRARELAERDSMNYSGQVRDLQAEVKRLRDENQNLSVKLARIEAQQQALEAERERDRKLTRLQANSSVIMKSLSRFGSVTENERGILLTLPENYWSDTRVSSFADANNDKLNELGNVLANSTDYRIYIESHTDNDGTPENLQTLTTERAQAVADKLRSLGVSQERIESKGFGAAMPLAPNTTKANRAKNRRVQLLLVPDVQ
ncbi:MAG: OmpA family protein [Acidobacteriota bacterium]|nr:OmpA family protein [Acidobacteriota bacterium]